MNPTERDQLLFDQFEETCVVDDGLADQARNDGFDNFRLIFDRRFLETVVGRMDGNEEISKRILGDIDFRTALMDLYAERPYRRLREPTTGTAP